MFLQVVNLLPFSFNLWKSRSCLRAVVNLLLADMSSGLQSVVYFIRSLNIQVFSELLTVVTLIIASLLMPDIK